MHIAHILRKYQPSEWGGTETALRQLTEGLVRHGVRSTVFCPAEETRFHAPPTVDPLTAAGCTLKRFHACVPVWGMPAPNRQQVRAVGGNLLSFDLPRMLSREPEIDVVHTHTLGRLGGIGLTIARRRRLPFAVTIHGGVLDVPANLKQTMNLSANGGFEWGRLFGWWWRARRVLSDADIIIACNPAEAALLRRRYPDRRIVLHPHGLETARFRVDQRPAARAAFPEIAGRKIVLCVGRIDPVKNQSWLVEQAAQFTRHDSDILLVFAGACTDPAYGRALRSQVATLGLEERVLFTGGLPPGDPRLIGLLQSARVVVLPSISETFGLVILEAWAAGAPVLASKTSGAKALISHRQNGLLFDLDKPASFQFALNRTLKEAALAADQASAGRRLVEAEYDADLLARRMREIYDQLLAERKALRHPARR